MSVGSRVVKNTGFLYGRMAITMFISLYSTRLILAALGADDFGIFNVVGGAIAMLTFLNAAMTAASQRFISYAQGEGNEEKQTKIINISILLHLAIGLIILLLLELAGYFLFKGILVIDPERLDAAKLVYQFLIISIFFTIISVPYDAVINAHENMLLVAIIGIIEAIIKLVIAIYITYTTFDKLVSYGFLMAILPILIFIIRHKYCHLKYKEVKFEIKQSLDKKLIKEMTSFAGWSFLGSAVSMITQYGQNIVINMFFGTTVNAAQGVANQVSGQLGAFSNSMIKALSPVIVKSEGAKNRNLFIQTTFTGSKISFFLFAVFAIPTILEMPFLFKLWLKDIPEYAIIFAQLLIIHSLFNQMVRTLQTAVSAVGIIRNYQISVSLLTSSILVISFFLFKAGFSPSSMYIVLIVEILIRSFGVLLYFTNKYCNIKPTDYIKDVFLPCISVVLLATALCLIPFFNMQQGVLRFFIIIVVYFVSFIILVYFIGFNKLERNQLILVKEKILNFFN